MPDVRRACAAPVLGTGSSSPPPSILAAGSSFPRALSLASGSSIRHRLAPGAHQTLALRSFHLVAHRHELITGTADGTVFARHGSSRAFALPVLRLFGSRRSDSACGKAPRDRPKPRNAQLHRTDGRGFSLGSSKHLRSRPGSVPCSSAAAVFLNPPRNHSGAPNPNTV